MNILFVVVSKFGFRSENLKRLFQIDPNIPSFVILSKFGLRVEKPKEVVPGINRFI